MYVKLPRGTRGLIFGVTIHLLPYLKYTSSESSDKTGPMPRLIWAYAGHLCNKYQNLMWAQLCFGCSKEQSQCRFKNLAGVPSVSNSLDPDQARHFIWPDQGPNCLQRLSAGNNNPCGH